MENFKIIKESENPLFGRKEIQFSIDAEVTPSNADVEKLIADKFSAQTENIKIKKIAGRFGANTFTITANLYGSEDHKTKLETKKKKKVKKK